MYSINELESLMGGKVYDESDKMKMTDRFMEYESYTNKIVNNKLPIIVRLDGHKFTKSTKKLKSKSPFNNDFDKSMILAGEKLKDFSKANLALVGSDEVSLIFKPTLDKNGNFIEAPWGGRVQKMTTLFASYLSVEFSKVNLVHFETPIFDARVFNIPDFEVLNYIMCRQISLGTNAVSQYADYYVGKKITHRKNSDEKIEMLKDAGINFEEECPYHVRYGTLMGLKSGYLSKRLRRYEMSEELLDEIEYKH